MSDDLVKRLRQYPDVKLPNEAADYIEKLKRDILNYSSAVADAEMRNEELDRALNRMIDRWEAQKARIEKLESALREIMNKDLFGMDWAVRTARKALDAE